MNALKIINLVLFAFILLLGVAFVGLFIEKAATPDVEVASNIPNPIMDDNGQPIEPMSAADINQHSLEQQDSPDQITVEKLPHFQVRNIGSADLKDDIMILNFFAMWCPKCARENALWNEWAASRDIPIYGIRILQKPEDNPETFFANGNPYNSPGA